MPTWFQNNYFKLNPKKCHLLATSKSEMTLKFFYCYLIWIFHSINKKNRIKIIHERTLRFLYNDSRNLSFEKLQVEDKTMSVYIKKNLQTLATEIFKAKQGIYFGTESLSSLAFKIRELLPGSLKNEICLNSFKQ